MTRRAVITGFGAVTPLGITAEATISAMQAGRCAIGPVDIADGDRLTHPIGAQIKDFDSAAHFSRSEQALYDPAVQFSLVAAAEAMAQAGLSDGVPIPNRAGVALGTGGGGMCTVEDSYRIVFAEGKNRVHPFVVPRLMANAAASHIAIRHGLQGPAFAVTTACASSNHAMAQALGLIRCGAADIVLTGGADAMLIFGVLKAWEGLRVMSPDGCRPFCASRNGMVHGEGAAVFVLESEAHARVRGATPLVELAGAAMTADAADVVMPNQDGAARALAGAFSDAGLCAGELGYINAHGTATAASDRMECAAIRQALGAAADGLAVSSTKSLHGHCMGGTGAIETLAVISALRDGVIPPTANRREADPECDLDIVAGVAREVPVAAALSNAFAFGGLNAVLAFRAIG